eukprot:95440_1
MAFNMFAFALAQFLGMFVGFAFFHKNGFGAKWAKLTGKDIDDHTGHTRKLVVTCIATAIINYIISTKVGANDNEFAGAKAGFMEFLPAFCCMCIGFAWSEKKTGLLCINASYLCTLFAVLGATHAYF